MDNRTTDTEKFEIIRAICKEAINIKSDYREVEDIDIALIDTGVDSLDFITVFIYIGDIWGISDDAFNNHPMISPEPVRPLLISDLIMCINDEFTLNPTLEDALGQI